MPYDLDGAVNYIDTHARPDHVGYCARGVINAIRGDKKNPGGGLPIGGANAKDMGGPLRAAGFQPVTDGTLQKGDIEVLQAVPGHDNGHIAMYDGNHWVSDHDQGTSWDGSRGNAYTKHPAQANRIVYRYSGVHSVTHKGNKLTTGATHHVHIGKHRRHLSHKHARHTAGKVVAGSTSVFVGTERYAVARVGDMTDDGTPIADGEETMHVG